MVEINIWILLAAFGIPTAIGSGMVGIMLRRFEKKQAERENARRDNSMLTVKATLANAAFGEETYQIIKGQGNGELAKAHEYMCKQKNQLKDFYLEQGARRMN